jgi:hypothetical protein
MRLIRSTEAIGFKADDIRRKISFDRDRLAFDA